MELSRKNEDMEKQRDRAVHENMDNVARNHDLNVVKDHLQRENERELREHQREKEAIERDHQQQLNMKNLEHAREMDNERLKAEEAKRNKPVFIYLYI